MPIKNKVNEPLKVKTLSTLFNVLINSTQPSSIEAGKTIKNDSFTLILKTIIQAMSTKLILT
jgi:hypothetical protein